MVSKPGKASRVLAMPEAAPPALQPQAAPSQQPAATSETSANTASAPLAGTAAPSAAAPLTSSVQVTAVEFEGSKIFVAGSAPTGSTVRALVDDREIGKSITEASGHFVVEGDVDLSVGSHIITVEELNADGAVKVRVRVPFERPQTDQATVAMQSPAASSSATATAAPAEKPEHGKRPRRFRKSCAPMSPRPSAFFPISTRIRPRRRSIRPLPAAPPSSSASSRFRNSAPQPRPKARLYRLCGRYHRQGAPVADIG